jgi:hypothetical protein
MYLTDMAPQATALNLETGEIRDVMSVGVKQRAPIGLRRYLLEEQKGGQFAETGEFLPMTEDLYDDLEEHYKLINNWNYDWPHFQVEREGDEDQVARQRVIDRLTASMAHYPYDFKITGLQRRFLMYYSDGNYKSQQRYERLIPAPDHSTPFRRNGSLRRKYDFVWNSIMRDASVPFPSTQKAKYGELRPCLYFGPAWAVRFTLDGTDVLLERCRVYVTDDAEFICSDWCQRHDFTSYSGGINLQQGIYSFDGWVTGPCLIKNIESNQFKPKNAVVKRTAVRELMKKAPANVKAVDFDEAFNKAHAVVSKFQKPAAAPAAPTVDAGPLTADALAEALQISSEIWLTKIVPGPELEGPAKVRANKAVLPQGGVVVDGCVLDWVATYDKTHLVVFDPGCENAEGEPYVGAWVVQSLAVGKEPPPLSEVAANPHYRTDVMNRVKDGVDGFALDDDDGGDPWYMASGDYSIGDERLEPGWWMYSAAVHYRDNLTSPQVAAILLEG